VVGEDLAGSVLARSTTGGVTLRRVRGEIEVNATAGRVELDSVSGSLEAETVSGALIVRSGALERAFLTTFSGAVRLEGALSPGGVYDLASQSGDVDLILPPGPGAALDVGTVRGRFTSDFPLGAATPTLGERFTVRLGSAAAAVRITTYSGAIRLSNAGG
jgi:DUF4097 and DUF4098 domain-containing protein YvlB